MASLVRDLTSAISTTLLTLVPQGILDQGPATHLQWTAHSPPGLAPTHCYFRHVINKNLPMNNEVQPVRDSAELFHKMSMTLFLTLLVSKHLYLEQEKLPLKRLTRKSTSSTVHPIMAAFSCLSDVNSAPGLARPPSQTEVSWPRPTKGSEFGFGTMPRRTQSLSCLWRRLKSVMKKINK